MIDLSPAERTQVRSQQCFFRATSDIPGHGRFYSADARFPCSVAVPGMPRFLYHRWDEQYLGVTFDIRGEEDVAIFRTNLNDFASDGKTRSTTPGGSSATLTPGQVLKRESALG